MQDVDVIHLTCFLKRVIRSFCKFENVYNYIAAL